jgi:hypothetical protein
MTENIQPVVISLIPNVDAPEAIEFFRHLGICITVWAFIDRRLYQIFHHTTGFEQKQSALIFYGDRTFSRRLRLVDRAIKAAWTKERHAQEWRPLHDQIVALSHTRNILAHQPTLRLATAKDGKPFDIYSIHIEPYERILNGDYRGLQGKDQLYIEDLKQHDIEATALESKLCDFAWTIGGWRAEQKSFTSATSPQI